MKKTLLIGLFIITAPLVWAQNPWNGKVFLQAFWWDYYNSNYPDGWYNYLAELAPRLREIGLDAVWIPPSTKASGTSSVGYDPFDAYDLGDKYQKGLKTRLGDKNEYLRMVAIMHANGIDVYQDVVVNHATNAELDDSKAWDNQWKTFRYVCYETNSTVDYGSRKGRWPKNWQNFHPNPAHNCNSGDLCSDWWGPDICYVSGAIGNSTNAPYNPDQSQNHMRDNGRNWLVWLKKQSGVDGFRFDAVKHFETEVAKDFLWNLQHNAGWASGGDEMFACGEFLDNSNNMDNWCNAVENRAGTFDFSIRGAIKNMTSSSGFFDMSTLPAAQQSNRYRTVPFVNNHDTFRPKVDDNGNYTGWDGSHETGGHIEPGDPRIAAGYAFALSVDGSPCVFFEDLFNVGTSGKRFSHKPTNTTDLPQWADVAALIHLYKQLNFKGGGYKVPFSSPDHLIVERSGKALIGINDSWDSWHGDWITTDFAPGTVLVDYAGSSGGNDKRTVAADKRVQISTPPCNGSAKRRGYSVWAPQGIKDFTPSEKVTTQEWEMADDLGDNHPNSLQQGGAIPALSVDYRVAGKIFAEAGKPVKISMHPSDTAQNLTLTIEACSDLVLKNVSGKGDLILNYSPVKTGWITIKARNTFATNKKQVVWIKSTYTAPKVIDASMFPSDNSSCIVTSLDNPAAEGKLDIFPNPSNGQVTFNFNASSEVKIEIVNILGQRIVEKIIAPYSYTTSVQDIPKGIYLVNVSFDRSVIKRKLIVE